ncbi:MAG: DUF4215 domain-containing protein [Proteobacteria bacterium]|nr:DUF4215 domain-containing protein [Pseudomonadota bacterium]
MRSWLAVMLVAVTSTATASPRAPTLATRRDLAQTTQVTVVAGASRDPGVAERAARTYLHDRLGARGELVLVANRVDRGVRTVAFTQRLGDLEVIGAQAAVAIRADRVFAASSTLADLPAPRLVAPPGKRYVIFGDEVAEELVVGRDRVYVGLDGSTLARDAGLRNAAGVLAFDVGLRVPTDGRHAAAAASANATIDGAPTTTDATGAFTWTGTLAATVVPSLVGAFVQIVASDGAIATDTLTAQPGATVTWSRATDERVDAQLAAYVYASEAKDVARRIAPGLAWVEAQLTVNVNETAGDCNASSDGDALHFFAASARCENTARLADLVHHEFGHSLHKQALIPGAGAYDAELSEGLADFFAANLVDDPTLGRGLFRDAQPMRALDPANHEARYPDDLGADPHKSGLIIAGALWDLRTFTDRDVAEAIYLGVVQRAPRIDASYLAAQIADDDDGDLANGTPHGCALGKAFALHGLAPGFATTTFGQPTIAGTAITLPFTIPTNTTCPPPTVVDGTLVVDGDREVPMIVTGATLTGALPDLARDQVHAMQIVARLSDGRHVQFPDNPADPSYQVFAGTPTLLYCATMDADPRWTATDAAWEYGRPDAPPPDPIAAHTGTNVVGMKLHGNGRYPVIARASITTPTIDVDVTRFGSIHLQYYRWLSTEDAAYDVAAIEANGAPVWQNATDRLGTLDHVDREWRFHDVDVTSRVANGKLAIAWTMATDTIGQLGGWTMDDVCVVGVAPVCGNGAIDADEECDDGNAIDDDGCTACVADLSPAPPVAGCCAVGSDPTGPLAIVGMLGLFGIFRRRVPGCKRPGVRSLSPSWRC